MGRITLTTVIKTTIEIPEGLTIEQITEQFNERKNNVSMELAIGDVMNNHEEITQMVYGDKPINACLWSHAHSIEEA